MSSAVAGGRKRVVYRADADAVVILDVLSKKTDATPQQVIATCRERLRRYDRSV